MIGSRLETSKYTTLPVEAPQPAADSCCLHEALKQRAWRLRILSNLAMTSGTGFHQLGNAACPVPIGDIDVSIAVDKATVRGTEDRGRNVGRQQRIIRPLRLQGIVAKECDGSVVFIENRYAAF